MMMMMEMVEGRSYLRCLAYFPLTWPLPSHPGIGQLRRNRASQPGSNIWIWTRVWKHLDLKHLQEYTDEEE